MKFIRQGESGVEVINLGLCCYINKSYHLSRETASIAFAFSEDHVVFWDYDTEKERDQSFERIVAII